MTDTTDQQAVTVAQEDREAAAALIDAYYPHDDNMQALAERYRNGHTQGVWAHAFARHRLASVSSASAEGANPDDRAVDLFAARMKAKLAKARANGRAGWDDPAQCSVAYLQRLLHEHVAKGDPVDVANFCMMLGHYDASTFPEPVPATNQAGEVEAIADDEALEAVADCFNGSDVYGRTEAWAEGKTLSVLFKGTGQIAKLRFVKLVDKPSNADLRGEPA